MDEWVPQIETCLWEADCGAELGRFPSGHPVWRIPASQARLLPETGQPVMGYGSGHGIPIKTWLYDGVHEMVKASEHFWIENMIKGWAPITKPKAIDKRGKKRERESTKTSA